MSDKLRIFVSGKEGELDDERAIVMDLITSLGFSAVGSERRPASSEPMKKENMREVRTSDIYIGIFGSKFSEATINEFRIARKYGINPLIFERELHDGEDKQQQLVEFLNEIKNPKSGLVIDKYKNVVDLKKIITEALAYTLTKKFKEAKNLKRKLLDEVNKKANEDLIQSTQKINTDSQLLDKMKKIPFVTRFSKQFGKAEFTEFKILSKLKRDAKHIVQAKISGSTKNGFLDLAIKDPDGKYYWFPDPNSYDSPYDNGILSFENKRYEAQWEFSLPDKSGRYIAIMGLYENKAENRECVDFEIYEFTLS